MTTNRVGIVSLPRPVLGGAVADLTARRAAALRTLHDLVMGVNGHRDLASTLHAVSEAACALGFGVAVINLVRADGALEVVAVAGDEGARAELLGTVRPRDTWDALMALGSDDDGVVFLDHRFVTWPEDAVLASWAPEQPGADGDPAAATAATGPEDTGGNAAADAQAGDDQAGDDQGDEDLFHPDDALFVHLVGSDGRRVGTLSVDLPVDGRRPGPETRELLRVFASHAALAIDHARLLADLRSERAEQDVLVRRLEALLVLSRRLAATTGRGQVVDVVASALPRVVGCDVGIVLLWDDERGVLTGAGSSGLDAAAAAAVPATVLSVRDDPTLSDVMTTGGVAVVDAGAATRALQEVLSALGLRGALAAPIAAADGPLGVVAAAWSGGPVPEDGRADTAARLRGVADLAAPALQNAALVDTIRHQSQHDPLTGLANRRLLDEQLDGLVTAAPDDGVAVLFCDLDGFKQVNDSLGHAAGDELLRHAAARLRGQVRPDDVVGRLGGDEFAVLLAGCPDEQFAHDVARRVAAAFEQPFALEAGTVRVSTSVGVAVHRGDGGRLDDLLRAADAAMYRAKRAGGGVRGTRHGEAALGG